MAEAPRCGVIDEVLPDTPGLDLRSGGADVTGLDRVENTESAREVLTSPNLYK